MGIIAWIILGLGAGLLANMVIPGKRSQGLILTCLIGIAGALGGGWAATELFHVHTLHGFFNLSTWVTAIAGSAVLLLVVHLVTGRGSRPRRFAHRGPTAPTRGPAAHHAAGLGVGLPVSALLRARPPPMGRPRRSARRSSARDSRDPSAP